VQARAAEVERRGFAQRLEVAAGLPLLGKAHGNVVALDQCIDAGHPGQRDGRFDHPELATFQQQVFGTRFHGQFGCGAGQVAAHLQLTQAADLNTVEQHRGAFLQAFHRIQLEPHAHPGFRRVEVRVEAEGQRRVGGRAVLAVLRGSEGNAAGEQAEQ